MTTDEWLRIGEVAKRTGLSHRTLRHYDELGLLVPSGRTDGDYRLYSRTDLDRLLAIQHLKSLGISLKEIADVLDHPGADAAALLARHIAVVEDRLAKEQELLTRLRRLQQAAESGWDEVLGAIALTEQLRHPEPQVRFRAALSAHAGAPREELLDLIASDAEPGVREAATWAFVQHGPEVTSELAALIDGDDEARHALAHVLGKLRSPAGLNLLVRLLNDPESRVAAKAAFSLGQLGLADAVEPLVTALSNAHEAVRAEAVRALAQLPANSAALSQALGSRSATARLHAAEALGLVADESTAPQLIDAVSDADEEVAVAALFALGQLHGTDAQDAVNGVARTGTGRLGTLARRLVADRDRPTENTV